MCASRRDGLVLALTLGACAATPVATVTPRADLPAAVRALPRNGTATAGGGPVALSLDDPRAEAESLARALIDALARGDEGALRLLFAPTVEPNAGDAAEGREQVVALMRPWFANLARYLTAPGRAPAPVTYGRDDCPPGACNGIFLRRGDWVIPLPNAGMLRASGGVRPFRGGLALGGPAASMPPPRFFVARRVDGVLRVVAVNDDFLR